MWLGQEIEKRRNSGEVIESLPMKAVATENPSKDKGRLVVCGDYSTMQPENDTSLGGACNRAIRGLAQRQLRSSGPLGALRLRGHSSKHLEGPAGLR